MMNRIDVSIIIPSYNSEKTIEICLNSIFNQKTNIKYEVIIVDSSPNNSIDKIIKKYPKVKFIKLKQKTFPGIARNIGAKKAKGELLIFVDSDIVLPSNFINKSVKYCKQGHSIFCGSIDIFRRKHANFLKKLEWFFVSNEFKPSMPMGERWCLPSCALAIHSEIFRLNQFLHMEISQDTELTVRISKNKFMHLDTPEDTELTIRIANKKNTLYFNPNIKVCHIFQNNFLELMKKTYRSGIGNMEVRKLHNVSGSSIIKIKILRFFAIPFFALFKFIKISWRNIRYNNLFDKFLYIFMIPLIILLVISWMLGFYKCLFTYKNKITLTKS